MSFLSAEPKSERRALIKALPSASCWCGSPAHVHPHLHPPADALGSMFSLGTFWRSVVHGHGLYQHNLGEDAAWCFSEAEPRRNAHFVHNLASPDTIFLSFRSQPGTTCRISAATVVPTWNNWSHPRVLGQAEHLCGRASLSLPSPKLARMDCCLWSLIHSSCSLILGSIRVWS